MRTRPNHTTAARWTHTHAALGWLLFASLLLLAQQGAAAENEQKPSPTPAPRVLDFSQVDIFLYTAGVGPDLAMRYGHNALEFRSRPENRSVVYNWGVFSFDEPGFGLKFFKGILIYQLALQSVSRLYETYNYEKRWLTRQKLILSPDEKQQVYDLVAENSRPENRRYRYHFFYDNCATRIRDIIDRAKGGALRREHEIPGSAEHGATFRAYVRRHQASNPWVGFFLDVVMNSTIDEPISRWEEMFLPANLAEYLTRSGILEAREDLLTFPDYFPWRPNGHVVAWGPWIFLALLGSVVLGGRRRALRAARVCTRTAEIGITATSAVLGLVMALAWVGSEHEVLKANANLLNFSILDCFGLLMALAPKRLGGSGRSLWKHYLEFHAAMATLALAGWAAGWIRQDVVASSVGALIAFSSLRLLAPSPSGRDFS